MCHSIKIISLNKILVSIFEKLGAPEYYYLNIEPSF